MRPDFDVLWCLADRFYKGKVQWPFGYGIGYTTFAYSDLKIAKPTVAACDPISLTVTVKNTGNVDSALRATLLRRVAGLALSDSRRGLIKSFWLRGLRIRLTQ